MTDPTRNVHLPVVTPHDETGGVHPATAAVRLMPTRPGPTAHPALPQPELDVICIHGLHVRGYHGVFDQERTEGQDFFIDADVWIDTRDAAASDDIGDTLHYGHLMRALYEVGSGSPVDLLETLAERLAAVTLAFQGPQAVRITVHKPKAPVKLRFDDVTVTILRFRPEGETPDGEIPDAPPGTPPHGTRAPGTPGPGPAALGSRGPGAPGPGTAALGSRGTLGPGPGTPAPGWHEGDPPYPATQDELR